MSARNSAKLWNVRNWSTLQLIDDAILWHNFKWYAMSFVHQSISNCWKGLIACVRFLCVCVWKQKSQIRDNIIFPLLNILLNLILMQSRSLFWLCKIISGRGWHRTELAFTLVTQQNSSSSISLHCLVCEHFWDQNHVVMGNKGFCKCSWRQCLELNYYKNYHNKW